MTYRADDPEVRIVPTTPHELDTYRCYEFTIRLDPNDSAGAHALVTYARGFEEGGTFYPVDWFRDVRLEGPEFLAAITAQANGAISIYDNVKAGLWGHMADIGQLPSGTIE